MLDPAVREFVKTFMLMNSKDSDTHTVIKLSDQDRKNAFRAGLLTGLSKQLDWPTILRLANVAAVYVIEHVGTQNHFYTLDDFLNRYRQNYGDNPRLTQLLKSNNQPSQE